MKIRREYSIAMLVLGAVGLLIFGINYLKGLDLFQKRNIYHVVYRDISGVTGASPVYFNGYKVGQVIRTALVNEGRGGIAVSFQLNEDGMQLPRDTEVRIYSADLFSRALQLVLGKSGDLAQAGDTLTGDSQMSLTDAVSEQIDPLKRKAEGMIANVDSVLTSLNKLLNDSALGDIDASFSNIRATLETFNSTAQRLDGMVATEAQAIHLILENLTSVSQNLVAYNTRITSILSNMDTVSGTLAGQELKQAVTDLSASSAQLRAVMDGLQEGQGSLGALLKNDTLYTNLENASRELDLMLEDLRLNPNRYVHLSLFGKKDRLPKLSDSDVERIAKALREAERP
jgi:phospholipid/cholesterol/gamma-HCH transport system substrate-binding protein